MHLWDFFLRFATKVEIMKKNKVPAVVLSLAEQNLGKESLEVSFLGTRDAVSFYIAFLADSKTGFPFVITLDESGETEVFDGFFALELVSSFMED